jgi:hypothetical protein
MASCLFQIATASGPVGFQALLRDASYGQGIEDTVAGDWFVLAHLGFFFMLLGCFGWAAWSIWKRTTRPEPHIQLIMELEQEQADAEPEPFPSAPGVECSGADSKSSEPWERPPDWWK